MYPQLVFYSQCCPDWPWTQRKPSALASQGLGCWVCATMPNNLLMYVDGVPDSILLQLQVLKMLPPPHINNTGTPMDSESTMWWLFKIIWSIWSTMSDSRISCHFIQIYSGPFCMAGPFLGWASKLGADGHMLQLCVIAASFKRQI